MGGLPNLPNLPNLRPWSHATTAPPRPEDGWGTPRGLRPALSTHTTTPTTTHAQARRDPASIESDLSTPHTATLRPTRPVPDLRSPNTTHTQAGRDATPSTSRTIASYDPVQRSLHPLSFPFALMARISTTDPRALWPGLGTLEPTPTLPNRPHDESISEYTAWRKVATQLSSSQRKTSSSLATGTLVTTASPAVAGLTTNTSL